MRKKINYKEPCLECITTMEIILNIIHSFGKYDYPAYINGEVDQIFILSDQGTLLTKPYRDFYSRLFDNSLDIKDLLIDIENLTFHYEFYEQTDDTFRDTCENREFYWEINKNQIRQLMLMGRLIRNRIYSSIRYWVPSKNILAEYEDELADQYFS